MDALLFLILILTAVTAIAWGALYLVELGSTGRYDARGRSSHRHDGPEHLDPAA
ncbi:MAG TPA: hypothetical protein VI452_18535 [Marmoricola sp.]